MDSSLEPTAENKRQVIAGEIEIWKNTLCQARLRYRTLVAVEDPPDKLLRQQAEVERCLKALDYLAAILQELGDEQRAAETLAQHNGHKETATEQG